MKQVFLQNFTEAHTRVLLAASSASRHDAEQWGPREILAHITAWETEAWKRIPLIAHGAASQEYDADTFNNHALKASAGKSFEQILASFQQSHQRLIELLQTLDDSAFTPTGAAYEWIVALTHHSLEHAQELEKETLHSNPKQDTLTEDN